MFLRIFCLTALLIGTSSAFAAKDEPTGLSAPSSTVSSSEEIITLGAETKRRINACEKEADARSVLVGYSTYNTSIQAFHTLIKAGKCYREAEGVFVPKRIVATGKLSGVTTTILEGTASDGTTKYYIVSGRIIDPSQN